MPHIILNPPSLCSSPLVCVVFFINLSKGNRQQQVQQQQQQAAAEIDPEMANTLEKAL